MWKDVLESCGGVPCRFNNPVMLHSGRAETLRAYEFLRKFRVSPREKKGCIVLARRYSYSSHICFHSGPPLAQRHVAVTTDRGKDKCLCFYMTLNLQIDTQACVAPPCVSVPYITPYNVLIRCRWIRLLSANS